VDQTLLNFVVRFKDEPLRALPPPFNLGHCLPVPEVAWLELAAAPPGEHERLTDRLLAMPGIFDFVRHSYVWHFNDMASVRTAVMRRTWRTIRSHYPGAPGPELTDDR
jgi:hypothetical protein